MNDIGTVVTLVLVLALVFYLSWLTTRMVAARSRAGAGRFMRVVDRMALGQDKALLLVKIGGSYSVISMSAHGMSLIRTLDAEEAEALAQTIAQAGEPEDPLRAMQSFGGRLAAALKNQAWRSPREDRYRRAPEPPPQDETIDLLDERVRRRREQGKW